MPRISWPDLATIHYSKKSLEWYEQNGVKLIPKEANPPNCPEQRVIESYCSIIKGILLKSTRLASDEEDFKKKWKAASKKVTQSKIQEMMSSTRKNIRFLSKRPIKNVKND